MLIRLNKFLSQAGLTSRRQADELIKSGQVKVNGQIINRLGSKINPANDTIEFQAKKIFPQKKVYLVINKPKGYLCTMRDDFKRPKVTDLLEDKTVRLYPVGRLDLNSEGLLILTNDGRFAYKLTHPRFHLPKMYLVELNKPLRETDKKKLEKGVKLEEALTLPAKILNLKANKIEITIWEGKKRQIKRMFGLFNYKVINLKRISIGPLKLNNLAVGKHRRLKIKEIAALFKYPSSASLNG